MAVTPSTKSFPQTFKSPQSLQSLTLTICIGPKPKYSKNKIKTKIKIPNPKSLTHRPNRCALSPLGLWFALIVEHNCVKFLHFNPETQKRTHSWDRQRSPTRGRLPQINSPDSIGSWIVVVCALLRISILLLLPFVLIVVVVGLWVVFSDLGS